MNDKILEENYKSPTPWGQRQNKSSFVLKDEDAKRKRIERSRARKLNELKGGVSDKDTKPKDGKNKDTVSGVQKTPLTYFIELLVKYIDTGSSKYMIDIFDLLSTYPKLKTFVKDHSIKYLPKKEFNVYSGREWIGQSIGDMGQRIKGNYHNWTLARPQVKKIWSNCEELYVMKTSCTPDKAILFIPAFTKYIEKSFQDGIIDLEEITSKPHIIALASKTRDEIILSDDYDSGIIVEIL
jgi:hypothetical protein